MIYRSITKDDLSVQSEFGVGFKISSSMGDSFSQCRKKFYYQYAAKIEEEKKDTKLLRRSCVVFALRQDINDDKLSTLQQRIKYFLEKEAYTIKRVRRSNIESTNVRDLLYLAYDFPEEGDRNYFTFDQFIEQCISSASMIAGFLYRNMVRPLTLKNIGIASQVTLERPIVLEDHKIIIKMRAQINLVDEDRTIYVYKIGEKRSSERDKPHYISESIENQCAVLDSHFSPENILPIKIILLRPVIKVNGDQVSFEKFTREVTAQDINDAISNISHKASEIIGGALFKEKSWRCPQCDYYKICINPSTDAAKDYIVKEFSDIPDKIETIPNKKIEEDGDDLPW
jgi:hypothetical protein